MTMTTFRRTALLLPAWLALLPRPAPAQELPAAKPADSARAEKDGKGKWVPLFHRHAGEYAIRAGVGPDAEAKRLPEPLLRWWQPIRGGDDGALYLWVRQGRPVAAVTFFTFKWPDGDRVVVHERHSFAQEPVEATWRGRPVWQTTHPGLTFQAVPDAPTPAAGAPARLRQMQAIARDVSALTTDEKGSSWTLRALTRPLFRYETTGQEGADGALFALAQGTDPEVFVFLEVRGAGKDAHWVYAVARFTDLNLRVKFKDREIFSGPHTLGTRDEIYFVNTVLSKPSDTPEDFN